MPLSYLCVALRENMSLILIKKADSEASDELNKNNNNNTTGPREANHNGTHHPDSASTAQKQASIDHNKSTTLEEKGMVYELPPVSFPATPYPIPNPRAFILNNFGILVSPQPQQQTAAIPTVITTPTSHNLNKRT